LYILLGNGIFEKVERDQPTIFYLFSVPGTFVNMILFSFAMIQIFFFNQPTLLGVGRGEHGLEIG
jgi:hypothetical protein